jgi:hypothetical protein
VEEVVGKQVTENSKEYKVRWKGYGPEDNMWELVAGLGKAKKAVHDFESRGQALRKVGYHVMNHSQCPINKPNLTPKPTPKPTPNLTLTPNLTKVNTTHRVMILSWTMKDNWLTITDNSQRPHQSDVDGKALHQVMADEGVDHQIESDKDIRHQSGADVKLPVSDGNCQSRSTITGRLCKQVLAYIKWRSGVDVNLAASVMDSLWCWLHNRGITVYIDPV